jgi:hypothetical protein
VDVGKYEVKMWNKIWRFKSIIVLLGEEMLHIIAIDITRR